MKPAPVLQLPKSLPPEIALKLFDFFNQMTEQIWEKYESELVELILEEFNIPPDPIELEFDDDIEF